MLESPNLVLRHMEGGHLLTVIDNVYKVNGQRVSPRCFLQLSHDIKLDHVTDDGMWVYVLRNPVE